MRTLLTTFSLAALLSLATACAVDPDSDSKSLDAESEALEDVSTEPEQARDAAELPVHGNRDLDSVDKYLDDHLGRPYCEQNDDCDSKICDQSRSRCRDSF